MHSWNEIQAMSSEQVAEENKKLVKRLVLTKFVAPIVVAAVVHYGLAYLTKKTETPADEN